MSWQDDDSEIEASRAPLMDHLVELRRRLIVCASALIVGFIVYIVLAKAGLRSPVVKGQEALSTAE